MPTIYQKHRPILFSEISGQAHIVKTLSNSIVNNRIGQAYLFTGSRGVGKTTLARIFSKTVNCLKPIKKKSGILLEPCNKCQNCLAIMENKTIDINEIDGASHTGVDNIRQLKEKVNLTPSSLKYKIYIIDEVHMLSIGAFNALLKTLEEPPQHVIFILATTELHKIPETIVSRCQRFTFNRLTQDQIIDRLKQIAKKEKVKIDNLALEIIATEAEGGMRDSESILNQIIALEDKNITGEEVSQILGTSSQNQIVKFIEKLFNQDIKGLLKQINELQDQGVCLNNFNKTLLSILRNLAIYKINSKIKNNSIFSKENTEKLNKISQKNKIEKFILAINLFQKSLNDAKNSTIPQLPLELACIEFYLKKNPSQVKIKNHSAQTPIEKNPTVKKKNVPIQAQEIKQPSITENSQTKNAYTKPEKQVSTKSNSVNPDFKKIIASWSKILETIKLQNHSIYACLKSCIPINLKDETFYIKTNYSFHKNRLNDNKNKLTIIEIIDKITQYKIKIEFITEDQISALGLENNLSDDSDVFDNAIQMMGGRVVD
jgi:DNA polymerase-3 subunit gamma/tau